MHTVRDGRRSEAVPALSSPAVGFPENCSRRHAPGHPGSARCRRIWGECPQRLPTARLTPSCGSSQTVEAETPRALGKRGTRHPLGDPQGRIHTVFLPEEAPLVTHSLGPQPHRDGPSQLLQHRPHRAGEAIKQPGASQLGVGGGSREGASVMGTLTEGWRG